MGVSDVVNGKTDVYTKATAIGTCDKHGKWSRETYAWLIETDKAYWCPSCKDDETKQKEQQQAKQKADAEAARRVEGLEDSGVKARHLEKTFDAFIVEGEAKAFALQRCKALAEGVAQRKPRQPSLILYGEPGTGKSHLACAMTIHTYDAGRNVCRISVADMVREFKDSWKRDSEFDEIKLIRWYGRLDLLTIEEIGVQHGSDTERMFLFEVVNARYENCLPTVLVSNLDAEKLTAEVGERVIDRLREDGGRMIKFTGKSWRKQ